MSWSPLEEATWGLGSTNDPAAQTDNSGYMGSGVCVSTLAHDGDFNRALPRLDVAFQMKDLLPGAQYQLSFFYWHAERWAKHRCL